MPTAAKLFSALWFAAIGFAAAKAFVPTLPEGTRIGWLIEGAALAGLILGWRWMGSRAAGRASDALGAGVVTSALMLFWVTFGFSFADMIFKSMQHRYRGVMEALVGVFELMGGYLKLLAAPTTPAILFVGGALGGLLAHAVQKRWK